MWDKIFHMPIKCPIQLNSQIRLFEVPVECKITNVLKYYHMYKFQQIWITKTRETIKKQKSSFWFNSWTQSTTLGLL